VLALNMTDALQKDGTKINVDNLSQLLGNIPIVHTSANRGKGVTELITKAVRTAGKNPPLREGDSEKKQLKISVSQRLRG
jgi:Fe2+ transport system protein B